MFSKSKNQILTVLTVFASISVFSIFSSQKILAEENKKEFGVEWGGFIRTDMYWDTRQTTGARESILLFLPKNEQLNLQGKDINATPSFYWGSMGSRLNAKISAPSFWKANVSGFIEAEFIGQNDAQTNVVRMRHAYANLDWGSSKLLIGQHFNPMFLPETTPLCVSANAGAPVGPLARNPQVRFTQNLSKTFSVQATAFTEREMMSVGPNGTSVEFQKNALIPAFNLQLKHKSLDNKLTVGASGGLKTIRPFNHYYYMNTDEVDVLLSTFTANVFMGCELKDFTIRLNGYYGGNMSDISMPGGYAVAEYEHRTHTNDCGEYAYWVPSKYTPFNNIAVTADLGYSVHRNLKVGVSGGFNMNLGTIREFVSPFSNFPEGNYGYEYWTTFNADIDKLFRVAPRATYQSGKLQFGAEVEYTQANYGKTRETSNGGFWQGKWSETTNVNNIRFLLVTTLFF